MKLFKKIYKNMFLKKSEDEEKKAGLRHYLDFIETADYKNKGKLIEFVCTAFIVFGFEYAIMLFEFGLFNLSVFCLYFLGHILFIFGIWFILLSRI